MEKNNKHFNFEYECVKGKKELFRLLKERKIEKVIIAEDNDIKFLNEIIIECKNFNVDYEVCYTKSEIGKLCKIDVPCGVIGKIIATK